MPCSTLPVLRIAPDRASSDERKELQERCEELQERCEELQERNNALEVEVHRLKMNINGMKEAFVDIAKRAGEWQDEKPPRGIDPFKAIENWTQRLSSRK